MGLLLNAPSVDNNVVMKTLAVFSLCTWLTLTSLASADIRIMVLAGGHARQNCPVELALPDDLKNAKAFSLTRESDGKQVPVQRFGAKKNPRLIWMIDTPLVAGESRKYRLTKLDNSAKPDQTVLCADEGGKLKVSVGGIDVFTFNHSVVEAPQGIEPIYRRSGYFHPIKTPQGNTVTGDFEPDHPHQHGLFNAWVNTTFRGEPVDFWNQAKGKGDVECASVQRRKRAGAVFAQFKASLSHVAIKDGKRVPAIKETLVVRVYNAKPFLFDIVSRAETATDDAIQVNEYHYGGFGMRGPSEWLIAKATEADAEAGNRSDPLAVGDFLTSSGRTRSDGNHTRARWVEMHGPVGSQHAGIIVMAAESNFRAPQTVRLHPTKPYFCFAPMVLGDFSLKPKEVYTSRFRYVVHDGPPNSEFAERMWQDYAHPPKVQIIPRL